MTPEKVWTYIKEDELQSLVVDLVNIPSRTGRELKAAQYLVDFMNVQGVTSELMQIGDNRGNAFSILRGSGKGPRLLINGHLDTSFTGIDEEDKPMTGPLGAAFRPKAYVKDGWVYGLGAINMKGGLAAFSEAACALQRSGVKLEGDVITAAVAGEIEKTQVTSLGRSYTGELFEGAGFGMEYLLKHGVWADFSITCEPTGMAVTRAKCGYVLVKLSTTGELTYRPYSDADEVNNAILSMAKVVTAVEKEFAPEYTRRHTYDLGSDDGTMKPRVNVGSIESGWPFKPGFVPAVCDAYIDMRIVPTQTPLDAARELQEFLARFERENGIQVAQQIYSVKGPSSETPPDSYLVQACKNAYEKVTGTKHTPGSPGKQSFGDDSLVTRRYGIPSVTWGPGGQLPEYAGAAAAAGGEGEFIRIVDVLMACKMYIATVLDICSKTREQVRMS